MYQLLRKMRSSADPHRVYSAPNLSAILIFRTSGGLVNGGEFLSWDQKKRTAGHRWPAVEASREGILKQTANQRAHVLRNGVPELEFDQELLYNFDNLQHTVILLSNS
jgi:hypothetical protein